MTFLPSRFSYWLFFLSIFLCSGRLCQGRYRPRRTGQKTAHKYPNIDTAVMLTKFTQELEQVEADLVEAEGGERNKLLNKRETLNRQITFLKMYTLSMEQEQERTKASREKPVPQDKEGLLAGLSDLDNQLEEANEEIQQQIIIQRDSFKDKNIGYISPFLMPNTYGGTGYILGGALSKPGFQSNFGFVYHAEPKTALEALHFGMRYSRGYYNPNTEKILSQANELTNDVLHQIGKGVVVFGMSKLYKEANFDTNLFVTMEADILFKKELISTIGDTAKTPLEISTPLKDETGVFKPYDEKFSRGGMYLYYFGKPPTELPETDLRHVPVFLFEDMFSKDEKRYYAATAILILHEKSSSLY